jgi:hypothetical protein
MDKKTLAALKRSIKKWKRNAAGKPAKTGCADCPLCVLFWEDNCRGCPVYKHTGRIDCRETPYVQEALFLQGENFVKNSQKEVEFLESLLPEGEK